tara:strand:+ start:348 stop:1097 length:750 start_codon:yes stop_codon:yes gene_type:complete
LRENLVNNFKQRFIPGFLLIFFLFFFYTLDLNQYIFLFFFSIIFYELIKNELNTYLISFFLLLFFLIILINYSFIYNLFFDFKFFILFIYLFIIFISVLIKSNFFKIIFLNIFIFSSLVFSSFLYVDNKISFFTIICLASLNDIIAYFSGTYIKGPKIAPYVSPNKTWSGTLISYFFSFLLLFYFNFSLIVIILMPICYFLGDIYFSFFKRKLKIKDYGNMLKGHGGFIDRFDSIFFSLNFYLIYSLFS